jgi:hypothetical protein
VIVKDDRPWLTLETNNGMSICVQYASWLCFVCRCGAKIWLTGIEKVK